MESKKIEVVEIEKPGITRANIARSTGMMVGFVFFIVGAIMTLTIILIIPGMFAMLTGLVVMVKNVPKADVVCAVCNYTNKAAPPEASVECGRCKTNIPIKWTEAERSFWTRSIFSKK